jgi:Putative phage tail protein
MGSEKKMKIGFNKLTLAVILATVSVPSWAAGTIIATTVLGLTAGTFAAAAAAFVINMAISAIITKAFFSPEQPGGGLAGDSPNPGNRQQIPPATDNKLPVVYGEAWMGGTITDLSISSNNQELYYVLSICEVTDNGSDTITFGDVYFGGKLCNFASSTSPNVVSLTDESTGVTDSSVNGKLQIFMFRNGSFTPVRGTQSAISVMQESGLTWTWDDSKLMTNCAFVIVHISYNSDAGLTGIQQTKFQVTNSRYAPGDCLRDYLTNEVYGAAIPLAQVNTASLTALNAYCAQSFSYTNAAGSTATQARFRFDGAIDTNRSIMDNLQDMASSCDALLKYNEITGQWGIITQSPTYTVAMDLNDSNMVSAIQITPLDIAASYNVIECKFPDNSNQDSFNSTTFDLQEIDPTLLFPNEPVNKNSVSLPLVNNDVRAQYIATRMLKAGREDLQVNVRINFQGIQLEAGDIVTVTNANYGWAAKLFRVMKVTEQFASDGAVTADLILTEFNPTVYDDTAITEFQPSPNTGIPDPLVFGTIPAPTVSATYPTATNPLFLVNITASSQGIIQYAELWYSAFATPTSNQLIFAGTTEIQSNGTPYAPGSVLPAVTLPNVPAGTWYFFSRMVNSLGTSSFSPASTAFVWKPTTFQYVDRYLAIAYADTITGGGFSLEPTNKEYYGIINQSSSGVSSNPGDYTWYLAEPNFGTSFYLIYSNRSGRKFSFSSGTAVIAGGNGAFVPSNALLFDPSVWSALPVGTNIIDLDKRTGQIIETGTTSVGDGSGELTITNNPNGKIVAQLKPYLDFGGSPTFTSPVANLTVDIYGRVVGFQPPDAFYFTKQSFIATSGQTVFNVTRASGYINNQCWVFQNGCLLDESEYIDALTTVTLLTGAQSGNTITVVSFKSESTSSGVYPSFTRNTVSLTNATSYTASGFTLVSGYEFIFINGTVLNELDYNITDQTISDFPSNLTGEMTIIQWTPDNLNQPNGFPNSTVAFTVVGQTVYTYSYNQDAFDLFSNGVILLQGTDYTTATGTYVLTNTPDSSSTIMVQQTFARTGAV